MSKEEGFEGKIAEFFDNEGRNMVKRHEKDGLPKSAQRQINAIVENHPKTAVDVGSGPGSVMIELLRKGVDKVTGVDLSQNMNEIAEKRLEKEGLQDRSHLVLGSFLEVELPPQDAVSLHRVLCCHPNRDGMVSKVISLEPETVSITILRDWKVLRGIVWMIGSILDMMGKFRPYVHPQSKLDRQFEKYGYKIMRREKDWFWTTTTYSRNNLL